jgi:hypothetical protein
VLRSPERPFPLDYVTDTSLVKISNLTAAQEFKAPANTDWLTEEEFRILQLDRTQISFLENGPTDLHEGKTISSKGPVPQVSQSAFVSYSGR